MSSPTYHEVCLTVTPALTAAAMGSGDLNVLATPALVALMEKAAMTAAARNLPPSDTTVGAYISTSHLKPTAVGHTVRARATITAVENRKITFHVAAYEGDELVGEGEHVRYVVDRERFLSKL